MPCRQILHGKYKIKLRFQLHQMMVEKRKWMQIDQMNKLIINLLRLVQSKVICTLIVHTRCHTCKSDLIVCTNWQKSYHFNLRELFSHQFIYPPTDIYLYLLSLHRQELNVPAIYKNLKLWRKWNWCFKKKVVKNEQLWWEYATTFCRFCNNI